MLAPIPKPTRNAAAQRRPVCNHYAPVGEVQLAAIYLYSLAKLRGISFQEGK